MPFGAPFHTVPKSACRPRSPQLAISVAEAGSTGSPETSRFQGLSAGKSRRSPRSSSSRPSFGTVDSLPQAARNSEKRKAKSEKSDPRRLGFSLFAFRLSLIPPAPSPSGGG